MISLSPMPRCGILRLRAVRRFLGGDIGGTQEGLRASIVGVQRAAVMGYPNWGSDTCGYNEQLMEQEVCGRWLAFSAFTPIMEVGPTRNVAFWNAPRPPAYDDTLIALWRMYARLHQRLIDYSHAAAVEANKTGMPIVRPLWLADPRQKTRGKTGGPISTAMTSSSRPSGKKAFASSRSFCRRSQMA